MPRRKRVLWVVPVHSVVYPEPFAQFLAMGMNTFKVADRYEFSVFVPEREILHSAMNRAVDLMLKDPDRIDVLLVSDDDCLPPADAILRLLQHYEDGREVVAGKGYMRNFPHTTTAGRYFPEGVSITIDAISKAPKLTGFEWVDNMDDEPDLVPVDFCGFPIAMIARPALEKIVAPWFGTETDGGSCTHDVYFGLKCQKAGVQIYVDKTIDCGHLVKAPIVSGSNRHFQRDLATWMQTHATTPVSM